MPTFEKNRTVERNKGFGKILLSPVAGIYYLVVALRNALYDTGIFNTYHPKTPTICVGNLTVGGTGKTPHIELLIGLLADKYRLAVLSRGYKRSSKGYKEVTVDDTSAEAGDEPLQIKHKFPQIKVAVNANRKDGIDQLTFTHPDTEIILLDDAFQHRKVTAGFNILLIDYNRPIWEDSMLPIGNLRDTSSQIKRANVIIVTKCPSCMKPLDRRLLSKKLNLYPYQTLLFSSTEYDKPIPLFKDAQTFSATPNTIALTGIAEPTPFISHLESRYKNVTPLAFPDHHNFTTKDISQIAELFNKLGKAANIITTEKDAKRLASLNLPEDVKNYLYFVPIKAKLSEDSDTVLLNKIVKYVRENTGNRGFYKRTH